MSSTDFDCRYCGDRMRIRTSKQLHPDYRKLYLECRNPDCRAKARAEFVVTATLSPSGRPNPNYQEKLAEHVPWQCTAEST
ncbi:Ogr/Delta-like zinc finger protein [Kushneria sinocarnis]|uniref:Ogr/Delta-like zinc finger protein n=1 Tax=Kushneria sinocarnis TaxID=595502 RepID=A0A420WWU2_9GAMM|nr:ogr/Delta-like zinc finger family protein [Kushneria sinocarnis]RKR03553.1 Ogr/Delta-like zinc finger protein [Kushneria sinocarnis]